MAYQVLARKWRPKRFQDVIGQKHITQSLQNILKREKIGQAYIFTGTRGIGKTSVARLFAKALRCQSPDAEGNPCNQCDCCQDFDTGSSMNVIEIDGASNNGVDNIRDLISEVQFLPSVGKYKIYIIDEVHMVTTQAFNALLKTLEEPPAHVIFLFATTEPEKLLGTVLSRCQRFDFRHASVPDLTDHLKMIADKEGIGYGSEELLRQIAAQGKGSVRDTLSLLDQVLSFSFDNKITEETLVVSLGLARTSAIKQMVDAMLRGESGEISKTYRSLVAENVTVHNILASLHDALFEMVNHRHQLESKYADISLAELFWIYESLARDSKWALESIDPERVTEILLQKLALRRSFFDRSQSPALGELKKKDEPVVSEQREEEPTPIIEVASEPEIEVEEEIVLSVEEQILLSEEEQNCEQFMQSVSPEVQFEPKDEAAVIKPVETPTSKDWSSFLHFLQERSPLTASYLEQGNIISPLVEDQGKIQVRLGFDSSSRTFYEYFEERDAQDKIKLFLAEFYSTTIEAVDLSLQIIEEDDFVSRAELEKQKITTQREQKREELLQNEIVREAQQLFNGTIDKVVLADERKER